VKPEHEQALAQVAQAFCKARGLTFVCSAGDGAFKATYRVHGAKGQPLAVKVYLQGATTERAAREVGAMLELSKIGHKSLPAFLDLASFQHAGVTFVLSIEEFLDGGNLTEALSKGHLSLKEVVVLGSQIAEALAVVEQQDLVHRDIKPDNIMFRLDGTAVLVDFGLVRNLAMQSLTQSWLPHGPGTPFYAAPEQLNNEKDLIDWRTDQFALGVTLALAAYGQHPYQHSGDGPEQVVARVAARQRPPADLVRRAQADGLAPIAKMIEPWPVGRFRWPKDLIAAWQTVTTA